jgi:hypothetical protein
MNMLRKVDDWDFLWGVACCVVGIAIGAMFAYSL